MSFALTQTSAPCAGRATSRPQRKVQLVVPKASFQSQQACTKADASISRRVTLSGAAALLLVNTQAAHAEAGLACADKKTSPTLGLAWCETQEGTGPSPVKGSLIRAHYTGRLASNGRVFDSSYDRRRPLTFRIGAGEVIRGWDLGILGSEADGIPPMKEGGKRKLLIPAELGYGARGAGGIIPPNAALEFDVELLGKPGSR